MGEGFLDRVSGKALGELLIEHGCITSQQCEEALAAARSEGIRLGEALIRLGHISPDLLSLALGEQFGVRPVELQFSMVDPELLRRFPADLLLEHAMLPLIELGEELVVLVGDPHNLEGLRMLTGLCPTSRITVQLADEGQIRRCLQTFHPGGRPSAGVRSETSGNVEVAAREPEGSEENFVRWLLAESLHRPDADLIVRTDGTRARVLRVLPDGTEELHDFHGALFGSLKEAIWQQCEEVSFTSGRVGVWGTPLRFAGRIYSLQVASSRDCAGQQLRFRPLVYPSQALGNAEHEQKVATVEPGGITVVLYEGREQLERYLDTLLGQDVSRNSTGNWLLMQEVTRTIYPGAASFPAAYTNLTEALLATRPRGLFFDFPAEPALIERAGWLSADLTILACSPYLHGPGGEIMVSRTAQEIMRDLSARAVLLESDGMRELDAAAALDILGGKE